MRECPYCRAEEWLRPECKCEREECRCPGGVLRIVSPDRLGKTPAPAIASACRGE